MGRHLTVIQTCVDYEDVLDITACRNRRQLDGAWIVATQNEPSDELLGLADDYGLVVVGMNECFDLDLETNVRRMNKGKAFNNVVCNFFGDFRLTAAHPLETTLKYVGSKSWLLFLDADIIVPIGFWEEFNDETLELDPKVIYGMRRRLLPLLKDTKDGEVSGTTLDYKYVFDEDSWGELDRFDDGEVAGYFHLVNAREFMQVRGYGEDWEHAGGYDSELLAKWAKAGNKEPEWLQGMECLHLGPPGLNWCGRIMPPLNGRVEDVDEAVVQNRGEALQNRRRR